MNPTTAQFEPTWEVKPWQPIVLTCFCLALFALMIFAVVSTEHKLAMNEPLDFRLNIFGPVALAIAAFALSYAALYETTYAVQFRNDGTIAVRRALKWQIYTPLAKIARLFSVQVSRQKQLTLQFPVRGSGALMVSIRHLKEKDSLTEYVRANYNLVEDGADNFGQWIDAIGEKTNSETAAQFSVDYAAGEKRRMRPARILLPAMAIIYILGRLFF